MQPIVKFSYRKFWLSLSKDKLQKIRSSTSIIGHGKFHKDLVTNMGCSVLYQIPACQRR